MSTDDQTFAQLDEEAIARKADEITSAKINELQTKITNALGGEKKAGYASIEDMQADIDRRAEEKAKTYADQVKEEIKQERVAEEEKVKADTEAKVKQTQAEQEKEWANISAEWREAVADGLAPAVEEKLAEKLRSGAKFDDLSDEEKQDTGLSFYNKARQRYAELKREGKAVSFYRSMTQIDKKPAGAKAPVFGGSVASPSNDDEPTDRDINEATNRVLGMGLPT